MPEPVTSPDAGAPQPPGVARVEAHTRHASRLIVALSVLLGAGSLLAGCTIPFQQIYRRSQPTAVAPSEHPEAPTGSAFQPALVPAPGIAGNPEAGRRLFVTTSCAGCHTVYGLPQATGVVGPVLSNVVLRPTLAGQVIPMTPQNMVRWLLNPTSLKPDTNMPSVGLTVQQAQDLTAYLYSMPYNPGS